MPPAHSPSPLWGVHLRLLSTAAIWGASWPWGKVVATTMPALTSAALRFAIVGALLLLWLHHRGQLGKLRQYQRRQWLWLTAAASTGVYLYAVLFMLGLQYLPASKAVVLITLNPAATLLLAAWLLRERLNGWIVLGMGMAVGGSLIALTQGRPLHIFAEGLGLGAWLILGCVGCWAAYTLIGRMLGGIDAIAAVAITSILGSAMLALTALWVEGPGAWAAMLTAPARSWASLLALAVLATALAYAWFLAGVKALGAGNASAYIALVPLFGMLTAGLWLGEPLHIWLLLGGAIAICGMLTMHFGRIAMATRA